MFLFFDYLTCPEQYLYLDIFLDRCPLYVEEDQDLKLPLNSGSRGRYPYGSVWIDKYVYKTFVHVCFNVVSFF